jgi:hypothetical protein
MKKMIKNITVLFASLSIVFLVGCNKDSFLDVNKDPNRATGDNITPYLIFPQASHAAGVAQFQSLDFLQNWLGQQATSGDFVPDGPVANYQIDFSFGNALWANNYNTLFDLEQVKTRALGVGDKALAGAALTLRAQLFQNLVDVYGNIPYSKAFQTDVITQPPYDKAEDIYKSLQLSLDEAVAYFNQTPTASSAFKTADKINAGDIGKWRRFANTLKLRMLVRQSEVTTFANIPTEITKIFSNGGVLGSGESVRVQVGYVNDVNKQMPFYGNYILTTAGQDPNAVRANDYFVNLLRVNNDPRLTQMFRLPASGSSVRGSLLGAPVNSAGNPLSNPTSVQSSKYGIGFAANATESQWIFTSVESQFLLAEAVMRGWVSTLPVQTAYENAVRESFIFFKVPNDVASANAYFGVGGQPIAQWSTVSGGTTIQKARFIALQKYIGMCGLDPIELWGDYRRLNLSLPPVNVPSYPGLTNISVSSAKISTFVPLRIKYPQTEYTANAPNVQAQGNPDIFTSKIFWIP